MRFLRRRLAPGETDHELLWLSVSIGSLAFAALWFLVGLPWPSCTFHNLTGLPCVTCGATRCTIAFFHGNFLAAWLWNPFVFLILCGVALFDIYALTVLILRSPRLRIAVCTERAKKLTRFLVIAALALNWIYLLGHYRAFAA